MVIDYRRWINERLRVPVDHGPLVLDLFAGCGGLALGFESAGFQTIGYEMDSDASSTYRRNLRGSCVTEVLTITTPFPKAEIIIGGPPCQPFSVGGEQRGLKDSRDGFPIFIAAVEQLKPRFWLFENVRGLLYKNRWYLDEIMNRLAQLGYSVEMRLLNAVRYGVPQNRERLIVVGYYGEFAFPIPFQKTFRAVDAVGDTASDISLDTKFLTPNMDAYIAKYELASKCVRPRDLHLEKPSRTLTCRNLAGATGDMMRIALPDGRRRRLTIREAARLQSFPDWFEFDGSETSIFNQIGNAVPPMFAHHLAESVKQYLAGIKLSSKPAPRRE